MSHETLTLLVNAARRNDQETELLGVLGVLSSLGLDKEDVALVAEQRALRAVLIVGEREVPDTLEMVALSEPETTLFNLLAASITDGIAMGWRAARQKGGHTNEADKGR